MREASVRRTATDTDSYAFFVQQNANERMTAADEKMRLRIYVVVLLLCAIVLPVYAQRYSSPGEAMFVGAMQGLFLMLVFCLWRIIRKRRLRACKSVVVKTDDNTDRITPWENVKTENESLADAIESITEEDMNIYSSEVINEKIETFKRMSIRFNCPISELKKVCISSFLAKFRKEELIDVIAKLDAQVQSESKKLSIEEGNTMAHYVQIWLSEYIGM